MLYDYILTSFLFFIIILVLIFVIFLDSIQLCFGLDIDPFTAQ